MIPNLQPLSEPPSLCMVSTTEAATAAPAVASSATAMMDASLNDRATKRQRSGGKGSLALLLDDSSTHTASTSASTHSSSSFTTTSTRSVSSTNDGSISISTADTISVISPDAIQYSNNNSKKRNGTTTTTSAGPPGPDTTPVTTVTAPGGGSSRRGVTFSPVTNIHSNKWTREEVDQGWYTKEELAIFKMERKALVKTLKKVKFDLSQIDQTVHCLRGYEAYFSLQANKEYKLKRQMVWEAVLREQQRQRYCGLSDALMMQLVSSHATQWARDTALNLGMADAQVALQIFLEYIHEQQEDDIYEDENSEELLDYDDCDYDDTPIAIDWNQPPEELPAQQQQPILFDMEEQGEEEPQQQQQTVVNPTIQFEKPLAAGAFEDYRDDSTSSTSTGSSTSSSSSLEELQSLPLEDFNWNNNHNNINNSSNHSSSSFPGALIYSSNSNLEQQQEQEVLNNSFSCLPQSLLQHTGASTFPRVGSGTFVARRRNSTAARAS